MDWPEAHVFAAMQNQVVALATAQKTLVLGLSIQDNNLQTLFARAKAVKAWPWPPATAAPAHVFCEDQIQQGQRDVLRLSYGEAYNADPAAMHEATLMRAWAEKVLIALVLRLLADKMVRLMELCLAQLGMASVVGDLAPLLISLRDLAADFAVPAPGEVNRTAVVNRAIMAWSRLVSLFRSGAEPSNENAYETLSSMPLGLIAGDLNAQAAGLGRLGIALSLLQGGSVAGFWQLSRPTADDLAAGALTVRAARPGAGDRPVFIVKSATEAIALKGRGAFANDNAIVVHADDAWHQMADAGASARRVRAAPGRTGYVGETHVCLGTLLGRCGDAASLQRAFVEEVML